MDAKHTPGLLEVSTIGDKLVVRTADKKKILAHVWGTDRKLRKSPPIAEAQANANLFAAAPDMLTALVNTLEFLGKGNTFHPDNWNECEAAIVKALGYNPFDTDANI